VDTRDDTDLEAVVGEDAAEFLEELRRLGDSVLNFEQAVWLWLAKTKPGPEVEKYVLQWVEQSAVAKLGRGKA
jgi:hypothetical protein